MALLSPAPVLQPIERTRCQDFRLASLMGSRSGGGGEIEEEVSRVDEGEVPPVYEEEVPCVDEEKIYVALGKDVKENKPLLVWALQHSEGKKICILHVHQPAKMIPLALMGGRFAADKLKEEEVRAYRDVEKKKMHNALNDYIRICAHQGVQAEKLDAEMDSIEKGIVYLISQHRIKRLIMGSAAEKQNTKKMTILKSRKAVYVNQHAHVSCHILFVCNGCLIHTREGRLDGREITLTESQLPGPTTGANGPISGAASPITAATQRGHVKSRSLAEGQSDRARLSMVQAFFRRVSSHGGRVTTVPPSEGTGGMPMQQGQLATEGSPGGWEDVSRSPSQGSTHSIWSPSEDMFGSLESISLARDEGSEDGAALLSSIHESEEDTRHSSPLPEERRVNNEMINQLQQATAEAKNSVREAFEESVRRRKAEKDAMEAIRKARASESLYADEVRRRTKLEEALARETVELNKIKSQRDEVMEELRTALDQKAVLESQLADSDRTVQELEEKIVSAVELLISIKDERDRLLLECDNADREAEELRKRSEEGTASSQRPLLTSEFSSLEIEEATRSFDPSLMIGGGGYGSVYKGFLRNTEVAIKLLHPNSSQGHLEFQQEVDVLSQVRHPNLVTLIGTCPEAGSLIYEYLPNGSLEDRLTCKDNTPPLSWQRRICIAVDVCAALIFLHSNKPDSIIHGDIKPANVLLDANFVSKLGDFGICRLVSCERNSIDTTTPCCVTNPKGTLVYMDPEFLATGELTAKSDVYSFGIILLRLLTGRPALGLVKEVQYALEKGNLATLLDATAGDWPFVKAQQLAHLALRCCEMNRKSRPDLSSDVWRVLEPMKASCGDSSPFCLGSEEDRKVPSYFLCPIFQAIMRDPHIAADGFTYEAAALKAWLDSGHNTSPMTNVKLDHFNLIPNHSLRSAIEEWLQKR